MKTAISIPDDVFAKAEALARKKKVSRSNLYVTALREYLQRQERSGVTEELNALVDKVGEDALRVDPAMAAHQSRLLSREDWWRMNRGEIYWTALPDPIYSAPGYRRPMLIVQDDLLNASRLPTTIACAFTSNLELLGYRGNMLLRAQETGLPRDSVLLCTHVYTVDRRTLGDLAGRVPDHLMVSVDAGLRLTLGL
jgi:mRNA interferase MazF